MNVSTYASSSGDGPHVVLDLIAVVAVFNLQDLKGVVFDLVVLKDFLRRRKNNEIKLEQKKNPINNLPWP